jgi:ribosomal protein S18 acetylase RimI-like enzyme
MTEITRDDGALDELRPLVLALKAHHGQVAPDLGPVRDDDVCWALTRERYAERLATGEGALFVARGADGRVAGFAFAAPAAVSADWPGEALELEDLAVAPDVRGGGVGGRLLAAVRDHAGGREVRLTVLDANTGARRFYAREGFVERARELVLAH